MRGTAGAWPRAPAIAAGPPPATGAAGIGVGGDSAPVSAAQRHAGRGTGGDARHGGDRRAARRERRSPAADDRARACRRRRCRRCDGCHRSAGTCGSPVSASRATAPADMLITTSSATPAASQPGARPACVGAPSSRRTRCSSDPPVAASTSVAGCRTQPFELGERRRVGHRIAAQAHREIVAAVLALDADPARQPPHRRVIEQQRLDERLQQVDEVVVTPDVRELVREDRLELVRRQAGQRARRQQDDRLQPADHRRHVDAASTRAAGPRGAMCSRRIRRARRSAAAVAEPGGRRATSSAAPTSSR